MLTLSVLLLGIGIVLVTLGLMLREWEFRSK